MRVGCLISRDTIADLLAVPPDPCYPGPRSRAGGGDVEEGTGGGVDAEADGGGERVAVVHGGAGHRADGGQGVRPAHEAPQAQR